MIPGYTISKRLCESNYSFIYCGICNSNAQKVIIKIFKTQYPNPQQIIQFKNEFEFTSKLEIKGVRKAYDTVKTTDRHALLLEYIEGKTPKERYLKGKKPMPLKEFLQMAIQMAEIIGEIHKHDIIHKDINPSNIIINKEGKVTLIDFGISTKINIQTPYTNSLNLLEGTISYISPEQTGRMNRIVDYRTDLYSLGATFYELLTGHPPFESNNIMELVHAHIAKQPTPLQHINPAIPKTLSNIVLKLLAKNAEDRYQSGFGLKSDLEKCLDAPLDAESTLGENDFSSKLYIPQKLYGRKQELTKLLNLFDHVNKGTCALMLVAGYSGVGKSSLIREIHRPIVRRHGYFCEGKFDQYQRHIPYKAITRAFSHLIIQILGESERQLKYWKELLLQNLGVNSQIIIDLIPELEAIIGKQPPSQILNPVETQNRLQITFRNFIKVFARKEHPLVLFLDDLQWSDIASLELLDSLFMGKELKFFFGNRGLQG